MTPRKRFYLKIREAPVTARSLPAGMRDSTEFKQLLDSRIIRREKRGRGYVYRVADEEAFAAFLESIFPVDEAEEPVAEGVANVAHYRDSKARQRPGKRIFLLRGWREVIVNDFTVSLEEHTANFGFFAAGIRKAGLGKVCSVENLDAFMAAEEVLGDSWTFLHPYGRIGSQPIRGIQAEEWLHFPDYDYTGLEEYLRIKEVHPHARLYLPDNLEALHRRFSKPMKAGSRMKKRTLTSQLPEVARVRSLLEKTGRFLEQEILLYDIKS